MANLPDLQGEVLGMSITGPDDAGFDPVQPWYVRIRVTHTETLTAKPYSVKLETLVGADVGSGVLCWSGQQLPETKPGGFWETDFHLPPGISQPDFGVKHAFVFTIDWKSEVHEGPAFSEAESNNRIVWSKPKAPPILPPAPETPPPPPSPWNLVSVSALMSAKNIVVTRIHNRATMGTRSTTLELHAHVPTPQAPAGVPELVGSAPIPQIAPGKTRSVTIVASRPLLVPGPDGGAARIRAASTPDETSVFTPLVRFTLGVKGRAAELGFGTSPVGAGTIKIPGKK